jgi:hypothetical protein
MKFKGRRQLHRVVKLIASLFHFPTLHRWTLDPIICLSLPAHRLIRLRDGRDDELQSQDSVSCCRGVSPAETPWLAGFFGERDLRTGIERRRGL